MLLTMYTHFLLDDSAAFSLICHIWLSPAWLLASFANTSPTPLYCRVASTTFVPILTVLFWASSMQECARSGLSHCNVHDPSPLRVALADRLQLLRSSHSASRDTSLHLRSRPISRILTDYTPAPRGTLMVGHPQERSSDFEENTAENWQVQTSCDRCVGHVIRTTS